MRKKKPARTFDYSDFDPHVKDDGKSIFEGRLGCDSAIKHDAYKPRYDLLPPDALEEVVKVFTYGAGLYGERNWEKGMSWGRIFRATMSHLWAFWRGEDKDQESGLPHLAHAATNCFFLLAYWMRNAGTDDRCIPTVKPEATHDGTP